MTTIAPSIRKAAVFIRSLDAETAATLLTQLSADEAAAIRNALRSLGPLDSEEQADVAAEFRRAKPLAAQSPGEGVALEISDLSATFAAPRTAANEPVAEPAAGKRFEFLETAPIEALVPHLAREHAQTIAVVLSYLQPARAAEVLAALPSRTQADTMERLAALGDSDPESVSVLEHELSAWASRQSAGRRDTVRRSDAVTAILAAASESARDGIFTNLATHKKRLAAQISPLFPRTPGGVQRDARSQTPTGMDTASRRDERDAPSRKGWQNSMPPTPAAPPLPATLNWLRTPVRGPAERPIVSLEAQLRFEDLIHLNDAELAPLMHGVELKVLMLAITGASEALSNRFIRQLPRSDRKALQGQLRQLGPTRLSDVEAAQRSIVALAIRRFGDRRVRELAALAAA